MAGIQEHIERARRAQQSHEQRHDVQLEVPGWQDTEADVQEFCDRRQAQLEFEVGRDPRD